jgi:hypothetical protein
MAPMRKLCATRMALASMIRRMMHTVPTDTRTLTIVLPEADWQALRRAEPDAIAWLQAQIRERLAPPVPPSDAVVPVTSPANWGLYDEY